MKARAFAVAAAAMMSMAACWSEHSSTGQFVSNVRVTRNWLVIDYCEVVYDVRHEYAPFGGGGTKRDIYVGACQVDTLTALSSGSKP